MHIQFPCFTPRELNEFNYQNNSSEKLSNTHTQQQKPSSSRYIKQKYMYHIIKEMYTQQSLLVKMTHNRKRNYRYEKVPGM